MIQLPLRMVNGLNCELAAVKFKHITSSVLQMNASGRDVVTIVYPVCNFSTFILCLISSENFENELQKEKEATLSLRRTAVASVTCLI